MAYELLWVFISYFGDIAYWMGFTVAFFIVYPLLDKKDKKKIDWVIYALLPAIFLAYAAHLALEISLEVPRPCAGLPSCPSGYSFPSGHMTIISAFATIATIYGKKNKLYLWSIPLAVLVGLSRVFLNFHTPVDVIGGAFVGIASSIAIYRLSDKIKTLLHRLHVYPF